MKTVKSLLFIIFMLISLPLLGAEAPAKPMRENTEQSLIEQLPPELQIHIINILATLPTKGLADADSAINAAQTIHALSQVNKHFNALINDERITNILIIILANHVFWGNRIRAAWTLHTRGAREWFNTEEAKKWFQQYANTEHKRENWRSYFVTGIASREPKFRAEALELLEIGVKPIQNELDKALFESITEDSNKSIEILLSIGANPNAQREQYLYETPIAAAAMNQNINAIDLLLAKGANPNPVFQDEDRDLIKRLRAIAKGRKDPKYNTIADHLLKAVETRKE